MSRKYCVDFQIVNCAIVEADSPEEALTKATREIHDTFPPCPSIKLLQVIDEETKAVVWRAERRPS